MQQLLDAILIVFMQDGTSPHSTSYTVFGEQWSISSMNNFVVVEEMAFL